MIAPVRHEGLPAIIAKLPELGRKKPASVETANSVMVITERLIALWEGSKAAGAWAIPAALPSSPTRLPSLRDGNRWASELKTPAKAGIPSPNQRIIPAEFGRRMIVQRILLAATSGGGGGPAAFSKAQRVAANIAKLPELVRRCPPVVGGFRR
jgi:hypothetical protein